MINAIYTFGNFSFILEYVETTVRSIVNTIDIDGLTASSTRGNTVGGWLGLSLSSLNTACQPSTQSCECMAAAGF